MFISLYRFFFFVHTKQIKEKVYGCQSEVRWSR